MSCPKCNQFGKKIIDTFTSAERILLFTSVAAMIRQIHEGRNDLNDRAVSSSVISKILLSFPEGSRGELLKHLFNSSGIDIKLGECAHNMRIIT